jgi:hypothetical protein
MQLLVDRERNVEKEKQVRGEDEHHIWNLETIAMVWWNSAHAATAMKTCWKHRHSLVASQHREHHNSPFHAELYRLEQHLHDHQDGMTRQYKRPEHNRATLTNTLVSVGVAHDREKGLEEDLVG